ncbi:hypothetical protein Q0Q10_21070 [Escherichia coli OX21:H7]|uniref:hypothetical protein n=1 Tax=Escherichia coli TaxID=562 RepID=UPI000CFC95B7|nr:hypothetical protein [Escherichia coli]MCQ6887159.1 hypothetical protein [Escherichia coli]
MAPFSLLALYRHEQPDCQEGRFPLGTGMNARLRRSFFSPPSLFIKTIKSIFYIQVLHFL